MLNLAKTAEDACIEFPLADEDNGSEITRLSPEILGMIAGGDGQVSIL